MDPLPQLTKSTLQQTKWGTLTQYTFQQICGTKQLPRHFMLFVPNSVEGSSDKLPVVCLFPGTDHRASTTQLLLHKEPNNAPLPEDRQTWLALSEQEGFLVAIAEAREKQRTYCVEYQWKNDDVDVEYVDTLLCLLERHFNANLNKVYGVGFSQGGLYMSTLAIHRSLSFAGLCNYMGGLTKILDWFTEEDKIMLRSKLPNINDAGKEIPFLIITSNADTNKPECYFAFEEFKRIGWKNTKLITVTGVPHQYLGEHTSLIWEFFKNPSEEILRKNVQILAQSLRPTDLKE